MRLNRADVRAYLGKTSSGKSTLARHQAKAFSRVLVFDPNGEDEWAEGAILCAHREYLVNLCRRPGPLRICWRSEGLKAGDVDHFEWANRCALAAEDLVVVWDEVDLYTTPGTLPPYAKRIVNAGRHAGLRLFALCRRPHMMNRSLSAQANRIMAFRSTEPRDLAYFRDHLGPEAAAAIPGLADYHAVDWTDTAGWSVKKSPFR